jgi:hypothetical protein
MEPLSYVNLGMSLLAGSASAALWVVQWREKRPQLSIHLDRLEQLRFYSSPNESAWDASLVLKLIVANDSTLPNAILRASAWLQNRDGTWQEGEARLLEEPERVGPLTELPLNLPARTTCMLRIHVCFSVPRAGQSEPDGVDDLAVLRRATAEPARLKVKLSGLGNNIFRGILSL